MSNSVIRLVTVSVAVLFLGCAAKQDTVSGGAFRADQDIRKSFKVASVVDAPGAPSVALPGPGVPLKANRAKVVVQKTALEKEFLLQVEMIEQVVAPMFSGMQSRVVFFRQRDNKVYMIEASKGHLIAKNASQTLVLAEFPVLAESAEDVTIDFNAGMSGLFIASDWRGHDFDGTFPDTEYVSVKAQPSYIEEAKFSRSNTLVVRQIAQLSAPLFGIVLGIPVEARYYLSPYLMNPAFTPTKAPRTFDRMGFFEVSPQFNDESGTMIYASKHDIRKPVVYAISANTPADFRQAVRDGILYWNRALGKDLIQAVDAPAGVEAPDADYNVVQWVDWDSAGFAYADAQMDPRTGEILHHQIYFTSAWARHGKLEIEQFLRKAGREKQERKVRFGLAGFQRQEMCDLDINEMAAHGIEEALLRETDKSRILKAAQDLIREVVAHEVGHTLGMRHNFAGSLAANYPVETREELFRKYLETGSAPDGLVTSSSVMDYQFPMEAMMNGDQIAKGKPAGDYDTKAMQTLYFGARYKPAELPLFCTDSHVRQYLDCRPYDAGKSYVDWVKYDTRHMLEGLPRLILEGYIEAKNPSFGEEPLPVDEVGISAKYAAAYLLRDEARFLRLYNKDDGRLLRIERDYPFASDANRSQIRGKEVDYVANEMARAGGLDAVLLGASAELAERESARFDALLSNAENLRGTGSDGKPFEFSADEMAVMKENTRRFYAKLGEELVAQEAQVLSGAARIDDTKLAGELAAYLAKKQAQYLLKTTGEPTVFTRTATVSEWTESKGTSPVEAGKEAKKDVTTYKLPRFAYSLEVRKKAAGLLRSSRAEAPSWAYSERLTAKAAYEKMISEAVPGLSPAQVMSPSAMGAYPEAVVLWLLEAQSVKGLLE